MHKPNGKYKDPAQAGLLLSPAAQNLCCPLQNRKTGTENEHKEFGIMPTPIIELN